jgi:hypothetical protein
MAFTLSVLIIISSLLYPICHKTQVYGVYRVVMSDLISLASCSEQLYDHWM